MEERLRHLARGSVRLKRHLPRVAELRGQESAHEDGEQRDVDGVCAQTIPSAALGEDEGLAALLRHPRLELETFARGADAHGDRLRVAPFDAQRRVLLLPTDPVCRGVELLARDVSPRAGEAFNRGEHDVQREHDEHRVEVPRMVDVEEAERAVEQFL